MKQVAQHPEIMLSRRELIRYVLATPGKRNEEVQALLHLNRIEEVRANLYKIANSLKKQLTPLEAAVKSAVANLNRALDINLMNKENILAAVNPKRAILHLPDLVELTSTTSLKDGMAAPSVAKPQPIPKKQATADIEAAQEALQELTGATTKTAANAALVDLKALAADPLAAASINRENFYKIGIALVEDESCPFCETEWDMETLRAKIQAKLDRLKELARKRKEVEKKIQPLTAVLRKTQGILNPLLRHAAVAKPVIEMQAVEELASACQTTSQILSNLYSLPDAIALLEKLTSIPKKVTEEIAKLQKHVAAIPEATKQDAAREFLTIAHERLDVWREAKRKDAATRTKFGRAQSVFDAYVKISDAEL